MAMKIKKLFGILLALALALGLWPGMSLTAYANDPGYNLLIDDEEVNASHTSGPGWNYTPAGGGTPATLTLNGASLTTINYTGTDKLSIVLENHNEISTIHNYAVYSRYGEFEISGGGSLTATGYRCGIGAAGITITSGTVTAIGGYMSGLSGGNQVTITGGTVTAASNGNGLEGGQVTITGGTVKAISKDGYSSSSDRTGLHTHTLVVRGGDVTVSGRWIGIYMYSADNIISGGTVTVTGNTGIYAHGKKGTLSIEGGTLYVTGNKSAGIEISHPTTIKKGSTVVVSGETEAIQYTVKNEIPGTGWTNAAGTQGIADIAISTESQRLAYKKVCFPAASIYSTESVTNDEHTIGDGKPAVLKISRKPDNSKAYDLFTGVEVDGKPLSEGNYTKAKGSLILTLKASYLDTLSAGNHKVTVLFQDGSATASLKVNAPAPKPVPKTGDSGNPTLWLLMALLGISLLGFARKQYSRK